MSEYWKSVPRKFCEFCKCWITDNKPSVDFHERGKRHQENVELKLKEIRKKSIQDQREKEVVDKQMEAMEKAAMEAFKKDLKSNPELAKQYGVSLEPKPKSDSATMPEPSNSKFGVEKNCSKDEEEKDEEPKSKKRKKSKVIKEWYEAHSPEGYSYYWSTKTGESVWVAPEEFVSVKEQAEMKKSAESKQCDSSKTPDNQKSSKKEKKGETEATTKPTPAFRSDVGKSAYGSWEVVREEAQPESSYYDESSVPPELDEIPMPEKGLEIQDEDAKSEVVIQSAPKIKFKEKTVTSLVSSSQSGPVAFKKRKVAAGARNIRQAVQD